MSPTTSLELQVAHLEKLIAQRPEKGLAECERASALVEAKLNVAPCTIQIETVLAGGVISLLLAALLGFWLGRCYPPDRPRGRIARAG